MMIYSSLLFIYGFLPISLVIYYVCPQKLREYALLFISLLFCATWGFSFLLFIGAYSVINYAGCMITKKLKGRGKLAAIPCMVFILADLTAIFGFRAEFSARFTDMLHLPKGFFPIGISFFTLSAIGTLYDVYRGRIKSDINIVRFALYIVYFPRLIMGPVLRYDSFAKLIAKRKTGLFFIGRGLAVFVKGLAKKVIAADSLYMLYTAVKSVDTDNMAALTAWLGVIAYILCLYFTLSGYADMGMGISCCFGMKLPQSFNYPLFSSRIRGFVSKWNTQVVLWFRRYFLNPIASFSENKMYKRAVFAAAWAMIGLWYTFSANGLIWGAVTAAAILVENRLIAKKAQNFTGIFYTVIFAVAGGVFFSSSNVKEAFRYLLAMLGGGGVFADQLSFYLLKSYIVLILISIYASTNLFRNMLARAERTKARIAIELISPMISLLLLMLCTAFISYEGSSQMILIRL